MRKAYSKPEIFFEDFSLTTNIAANCDVKTNTPSLDACGVDMGGDMVMLDKVTGCITKITDGYYDSLCYHNPTEFSNMFNS